jgi:hypothetical protein
MKPTYAPCPSAAQRIRTIRRTMCTALLLGMFAPLTGCRQSSSGAETPPAPAPVEPTATPNPAPTPTSVAPPPAGPTAVQSAFRNAAVDPPPGYAGPLFQLSADYPTQAPVITPGNSPWLKVKVDFGDGKKAPNFKKGGWAEYMKVILDYVKRDQDPNLANEVGFKTQIAGTNQWFHMPWMAFDLHSGREFVHGCTNERTAFLDDLNGPSHRIPERSVPKKCEVLNKAGFESWSVGFYNDFGGWAIGQAIPHQGNTAGVPQTVADTQGNTIIKGLPFPEGTLVTKILTTSAPPECVPALKNAPAWTVDRHKYDAATSSYLCEREVGTTHILQLDVAVVDSRSPIRWVYGTFIYDGNVGGKTFWERLVPLGVEWGSDPDTWPATQPKESKPVLQSVLNPNVHTYQHEGCNGRLAGPVDNPKSSCVSCHAAGYAVAPVGTVMVQGLPGTGNIPPIFGFDGLCPLPDTTQLTDAQLQNNKDYFANYAFPAAYPGYPSLISMDSSLQLQEAMSQYAVYVTNNQAPLACKANGG